MSSLTQKLSNTKTAQWYAAQLGPGRPGRRRTYVHALHTAVNESPTATLSRDAIVAAVGGRTSSTLYSLVGQSSRASLLNQHGDDLRRTQRYGEVVDGLVIETKVWSHWRFREGWLDELVRLDSEDSKLAAETLIRVLVTWATRNPHLAVMLECAPPLSAVEDLLVICGGNARLAEQVAAVLTQVVTLALDPAEPSSSAVLDMVRDKLNELLAGPRPPVELALELADRVTEALADLEYHLPALSPEQRRNMHDEVRPQLITLLRSLEEHDA
ncbi:hypothetical protein ACPXB5_20800 [Micromonospora arida]|uniref:hypothetical protein n=1 Tax=Micromonospora arida TaxID=2203715 RepID=UPI003CF66113